MGADNPCRQEYWHGEALRGAESISTLASIEDMSHMHKNAQLAACLRLSGQTPCMYEFLFVQPSGKDVGPKLHEAMV